MTTSEFDKNMILYGPPGTGKIYNTAIYAVAICDDRNLSSVLEEQYEVILERYSVLKKEGRVAFTTFHHMLMQWSKVFLKNKSFTTFSGTESAKALLFLIEKVFEAYVAQSMRKAFAPYGWEVSVQDKGQYLFNKVNGETHHKFALRPDLVATRDDGSVVILDTKWKRLIDDRNKITGFPRVTCIRCMHIQRNITLRRFDFCTRQTLRWPEAEVFVLIVVMERLYLYSSWM